MLYFGEILLLGKLYTRSSHRISYNAHKAAIIRIKLSIKMNCKGNIKMHGGVKGQRRRKEMEGEKGDGKANKREGKTSR